MARTKMVVLTVAAGMVLLSGAEAAWGGSAAEVARMVPADTVLFASVGDFGRLAEKFKETTLYKFYQDPAMQPFVGP